MNNISIIHLSEPSLVVTFAYNTSTSEGSSFMHSTPLSSTTTGWFCKCLLKTILNSSTLLEAHLIKVFINEVKCAPFLSPNFEIIHYHKTQDFIHVQYSDIMRFMLLHNRHHKVSLSVLFFMHCKTVTILLRIRVRGHFMMSITKNHESHYVAVLDNPPGLLTE